MPPRESTAAGTDSADKLRSLIGTGGQARKYTTADVEKHSTPEDCWVIVHEKVYDVTSFVPRHPGGNMIWVKAGGDCTQLFDSYHPLRSQATLDKYYIGELERVPGDEDKIITYNDDMKKGKFYMDRKVAVERWFKDNKKDPRVHPEMYIKSFVILAGVAVCHYCSFFLTTSFLAAAFAALHGMWKAEIGASIQHDANHGAYGKSRTFLHAMQLTLDAAGASSFMWRQQHVVGHHAYTNVDGIDPDIRCAPEKDIRRVNEHQPHEAYHPLQHIYLALAYGLLSFKSCFADDFNAYFSGRIGWVKVAKFTWGEALAFWGSKAAWAFYYSYLPAKCQRARQVHRLRPHHHHGVHHRVAAGVHVPGGARGGRGAILQAGREESPEPRVGRVAAVQQRGLRARQQVLDPLQWWPELPGGAPSLPGRVHCYYPDICARPS